MTALLDAAALAERIAAELPVTLGTDRVDALRLLAKHARESAKRVTLTSNPPGHEDPDDLSISIDGVALTEDDIEPGDLLDPDVTWLIGIDCLANIVRTLGGTVELMRNSDPVTGERIATEEPR